MRHLKMLAAGTLLALATVACGGSTNGNDTATDVDTPTPTATATVDAAATVQGVGTKWEPAEVTIKAGEAVKWTWSGSLPHNAVAVDGSWTSGALVNQGEYTRTFDTAGEYKYYCEAHGTKDGTGMFGTVKVT